MKGRGEWKGSVTGALCEQEAKKYYKNRKAREKKAREKKHAQKDSR